MKKIRKKRQLTPEQKAVLVDRITKARAAKKPAAQISIHESICNLPDSDILSPKSIRSWIKNQKDKLSGMKGWRSSKEKGQKAAYLATESYIHNLQAYLRDGVYRDLFYGDEAQYKIKYRCTTMAYNSDGTPKRTIGVLYSDIGIYTQEMADEENASRPISNKNKVRQNGRSKSTRASV